MEILAIASSIFFVKVILCCILVRNCKTTCEKVKKIIVNSDKKICKESTGTEYDTPPKPPRGVKKVKKGQNSKSDNLNLPKNISANNVQAETFYNDDYIRSKVYKSYYCNQCRRISSDEEARFREESVQSERHSKDALRVSKSQNKQEQKSSSEIGIDSSQSIPQTSKVIKTIEIRNVTNSLESKNSQHLSQQINDETETTYMNIPNKMYKKIEKKEILTSTKLKHSSFHKLGKCFVAGLQKLFRIKN